eukprot:TRINITY_DN10706_c0_g2_i7.p1 TRINITY_DN10706_c0_g2~~TRINITY_DN10706_c0_g2_i7.p1  ORF type:complete len:1983 (+),score=265.32 TRINITY_DN10706_c0_g2_i7:601-5949(+)
MTCPGDEDRSHAWSATLANAQNAYTTANAPVGSLSASGAMVFCYLTSLDYNGAVVVPNPLFGGSIDPGTYVVTYSESLCSASGGQCPNPIGEGRAALQNAAVIPFISNVFVDSDLSVVTQIAFEPFGYTRLTVTAALQSNAKTATDTVDIGGPMTGVTISCSSGVLDPNDATGVTCLIKPQHQESATLVSATAGFKDDFVVSDVQGAVPSNTLYDYIALGGIVKSAVTTVFKDWNGASAPGFEFKFDVTPMAQPDSFDGALITLYAQWNRSVSNYSRTCLGVPTPTPTLFALQTPVSLTFAHVPSPSVHLLCNGAPCSADTPGTLSMTVSSGYSPLIITPIVSGSGTSTLYFQEGSRSVCWTSPNFTYSGSCITAHVNFTTAVGSGGELTLTSKQIPVPGRYYFEVQSTFSYTINHTTNAQSKVANASVIVDTNQFDATGTTQVPEPAIDGSGEVLVYCQDFNDSSSVRATVTVQECDAAGNLLPGSTQQIATVVDNFAAVTEATAVQLTELIFLDTSGTADRLIPTARAVVTQVGADNPLTGGDPRDVFDNDLTTQWVDFNKQKISISLKVPEAIDHFTMVTGLDHPENDITQWTLRGSYDNVNWVTLHQQLDNYNVPSERGYRLPWFPLTRWSPIGSGCTGCKIMVITDTVVSQFLDCQWQCEKLTGCTHINWNATDSSCELLSCLVSAPAVINATSLSCMQFSPSFQFLEFVPHRTRETPLPIWLFNRDEKAEAFYKAKCYLEDAGGAQAEATTSVLVTLKPLVRPVLTSEADSVILGYLQNLTAQADDSISTLAIDQIVHYVRLAQIVDVATGNVRVQLGSGAAGIIERKMKYLDTVNEVGTYSGRLVDAIVAIAELVNVAVSSDDPQLDETAQDSVNEQLVALLSNITDPVLNRSLTRSTGIAITKAVKIILLGMQRENAIPKPTSTKREAKTLGVSSLSTSVDMLLQTICDVGDAMLAGTPLGACYNCTECAANGVNLHACHDTAYNLLGTPVSPDPTTSFTIGSYIRDASGRIDFNWPLSLVGFTVGLNPRAYDSDSVLLKGKVGFLCLKNHSAVVTQRVNIDLVGTDISATVELGATNTASSPVGIARRTGSEWNMTGCNIQTVVATATGTTQGVLTETCSGMTAGKPTEYASVSVLKYGRCMAGDIEGCVHVVSTDKTFEQCECDRCTSASSTSAPSGYYVEPAASGKYCIPYKTYSCSANESYAAVLSAQCIGNSVLRGDKCVCGVGSVCTGDLCEDAKRCGDSGSSEQCTAAGLVYDSASLTCQCTSNHYCSSHVCLEKVDCSTNRIVPSEIACTNMSRFDPYLKRCTCGATRFCNPTTNTCELKAKCGTMPYQPESQYCWPATITQPQLIAADNYQPLDPNYTDPVNAKTIYCQCPDALVCNTTLEACTCPKCVRGVCLYTADVTKWGLLDHRCYCPEGYVGADCSEYEEPRPEFLMYRFADGDYEGYSGLAEQDQETFANVVKEVVTEQGMAANAGATDGSILFSGDNVTHIYIDEGSIVVRVEVWVFSSAWARRLQTALVQDRVAVLIAEKLATSFPEDTFATLGSLHTVAATNLTVTCGNTPVLPNCAVAAAPWAGCACLVCQSGFVWESDRCINNTACDNIRDCNGRGQATGLVSTGCTCSCEQPGFSGAHCEVDDCLASVEAWKTPDCGPLRCSQRADGRTRVGSGLGECAKPSSSALSQSSLIAVIVLSSIACILLVVMAFFCITHRCIWESSFTDLMDDDDKIEEELGQDRGPNSYRIPTACPDPGSADASECSVDDADCHQG